MTNKEIAAFESALADLRQAFKAEGTKFVSPRHGIAVRDLTGAGILIAASLDEIAHAVRELAAAVDRHNVRST